MRASAGRAAIIDALEAVTLDTKARAGDEIRVLRTAEEPTAVRERVHMVRLVQGPDKDEANTCDAFKVVYQVSGYYAPSTDIDDRIAADNERLYRALRAQALIAAQSGIMDVALSSTVVEESARMVVTRRDVTLLYRLDASLI